jgi:hypothetical protein
LKNIFFQKVIQNLPDMCRDVRFLCFPNWIAVKKPRQKSMGMLKLCLKVYIWNGFGKSSLIAMDFIILARDLCTRPNKGYNYSKMKGF